MVIFLEKFFDVEKYIFRGEVFGLFIIEPLHFEVIDGNRTCDLNNVNKPIAHLILEGLKGNLEVVPLQVGKVTTFEGNSNLLIQRVQL